LDANERRTTRDIIQRDAGTSTVSPEPSVSEMSAQDEHFMRMAIKESMESKDENDGRVHPKVGVVVVRDGRVLATAYRGEIELGNHAEYTALERKLLSTDLTGATLYTTLEPCTSRAQKTPCADRVILRRISRVVIGAIDPNPDIIGGSVGKLKMAGVQVGFAKPDLENEIKALNKAFFDRQSAAAHAGFDVGLNLKLLRSSERLLDPAFLFPITLTLTLGFLSWYFYPFGGSSRASFWFGLSGTVVVLLSFVWGPSAIVYVVTKVSLSRLTEMPRVSLESLFRSIWKRVFRNRVFLKGALLLVLLAFFFTMTDAEFAVVSPRINHVVTQNSPWYFVTGSISNYRVTVHVNKVYFIDSPRLWLIGNIAIPNPSNYSYAQPNYPCYYGSECSSSITATVADSRAQLVPVADESGRIRSFEVILSPTSETYTVVLSAQYDDYIHASPIVAHTGTPLQVGDLYYQEIDVTLTNPLSGHLSIRQLQIGQFNSILGVSCTRDNIAEQCTNNSTQQLFLWPQELDPSQTLHFAINVTYSMMSG